MLLPEIQWTELMPNVAIAISFIPLILGLFIVKRSDYGIRAIIALAAISVMADVTTTIFNTQTMGVIVGRIFSFLEFIMISIFFLSVTKRMWLRKAIWSILLLFPLIVVGDAIVSHSKNLRDDPVTVCESIIFVVYAVTTLYFMMKDMEFESITTTIQFWILSAVLLYFGGAIFVFSSSNYAASISLDAFTAVWMIHSIILIIYSLTISIGFWKARKQYQ